MCVRGAQSDAKCLKKRIQKSAGPFSRGFLILILIGLKRFPKHRLRSRLRLRFERPYYARLSPPFTLSHATPFHCRNEGTVARCLVVYIAHRFLAQPSLAAPFFGLIGHTAWGGVLKCS